MNIRNYELKYSEFKLYLDHAIWPIIQTQTNVNNFVVRKFFQQTINIIITQWNNVPYIAKNFLYSLRSLHKVIDYSGIFSTKNNIPSFCFISIYLCHSFTGEIQQKAYAKKR